MRTIYVTDAIALILVDQKYYIARKFIFSLVYDKIGKDLMRGKEFCWSISIPTLNTSKHCFSEPPTSVCFIRQSKNQAN